MVRMAITFLFGCFTVAAFAQQPGIGADSPAFTTFDVAGAGTGPGQGTIVVGMNATQQITGYYVDAANVAHGFVRAASGTITTFDAPGAASNIYGTMAASINAAGVIAGSYADASEVFHSFIRAADGVITTFDVAGAGTAEYQGDWAASINTSGVVVGSYVDAENLDHGYLRAVGGAITTFDAPSGGGNPCPATYPSSINAAGTIVGNCSLGLNLEFSFVRAVNGAMTAFEVEGDEPTDAEMINDTGSITGYFYDPAKDVLHGFVRDPSGDITIFLVPGSGTALGEYQGTRPIAIGPAEVSVGYYTDSSYVYHGYARHSDGQTARFDAPGAGSSANQGTVATAINQAGVIAGYYLDAASIFHGFVLTP
jgi:predicted membrane protein